MHTFRGIDPDGKGNQRQLALARTFHRLDPHLVAQTHGRELDEGAVDESGPLALRNLSAALFSLEKSQDTTNMGQIVTALISWLGAPTQDSLRRAFTVWMRRVLLPGRLPGVTMPPLGD